MQQQQSDLTTLEEGMRPLPCLGEQRRKLTQMLQGTWILNKYCKKIEGERDLAEKERDKNKHDYEFMRLMNFRLGREIDDLKRQHKEEICQLEKKHIQELQKYKNQVFLIFNF